MSWLGTVLGAKTCYEGFSDYLLNCILPLDHGRRSLPALRNRRVLEGLDFGQNDALGSDHTSYCLSLSNRIDSDLQKHSGQRPGQIDCHVSIHHSLLVITPIRAYLYSQFLFNVSYLFNQDLRVTCTKLPSFYHTQSTMSSNLDMLYQEYDRALDEIKIKDRKLTSKMKEIHFWFVS